MNVTFYGQSCLAVELAGTRLLFDPFIRQNELAKNVDVDAIRADYILVTHGHFDHVADAAELAKLTGAPVIADSHVARWLQKQGAGESMEMGVGGSVRLPFGRVKYVRAVHGSTMPDDSEGGVAGGFVVESAEGNFYHSGDTALTMDMQLIGQATKLSFAALCIGDHFTMGVDDAIRAADFVRCDRVLGIHYDTFPPIRIDHEDARKRFCRRGQGIDPHAHRLVVRFLISPLMATSDPSAAKPTFTRQCWNYFWRATWLKCPVCGTQPMFPPLGRTRSLNDWLTPLDGCPRCGYPYEREPGYFLMSIWAVGYIVAAAAGVAVFIYLQVWHTDMATWKIITLSALTAVAVNVIFARHAKAYFLAIDHLADPYIPPSQTDGSEPDDDGSDGDGGRRLTPGPLAPGPVNEVPGGSPDPAGQPGSGIERERAAGQRKVEETVGVG